MLDGEMFAEWWIALLLGGWALLPPPLIFFAYLAYVPKAVGIRMKINKVRKYMGMDEIQYKAAMFSKTEGEPAPKKDDEPDEATEALLDELLEEMDDEEAGKEEDEGEKEDDEAEKEELEEKEEKEEPSDDGNEVKGDEAESEDEGEEEKPAEF